jgi:hypothetical protein
MRDLHTLDRYRRQGPEVVEVFDSVGGAGEGAFEVPSTKKAPPGRGLFSDAPHKIENDEHDEDGAENSTAVVHGVRSLSDRGEDRLRDGARRVGQHAQPLHPCVDEPG